MMIKANDKVYMNIHKRNAIIFSLLSLCTTFDIVISFIVLYEKMIYLWILVFAIFGVFMSFSFYFLFSVQKAEKHMEIELENNSFKLINTLTGYEKEIYYREIKSIKSHSFKGETYKITINLKKDIYKFRIFLPSDLETILKSIKEYKKNAYD